MDNAVMSIKRKTFNAVVDFMIRAFRLNKATALSCSLLERVDPVFTLKHNGITYTLACPNNLARWRAETYFTKEPETIEWIDTFEAGDVLFDIGANVGLYSIYAAKRGIRVIALEPESQNYALLNKNVYLNKCNDKIMCLNLALSDIDSYDYLYVPRFETGGAINCFGNALDEQGRSFTPVFKQGIASYALDSFILSSKFFPSHIKIDVDGIEPKIIEGASNTLKDQRLKSMLIEINEELPEHKDMIGKIEAQGFKLRHRKHSDMFASGKYSKIYNYIFARQ